MDQQDEKVPTKREIIIEEIELRIRQMEGLPGQALSSYVSHYDHMSLLILLKAALELD